MINESMNEFEESGFEAPQGHDVQFVVDVDGFEGPLDLLLELARKQKVDIAKISILALAEQYLVFVDRVRRAHLDLAAEYLVMAAYLAYLKSHLLLPRDKDDETELDAQMQAEVLAWRLARKQAMLDASDCLMRLTRLGVDVLPCGRPEGIRLVRAPIWRDTLNELVLSYASQKARQGAGRAYRVARAPIMTVDDAFKILSKKLQISVSWETLEKWLPNVPASSRRSALASSFSAMLIMAKDGLIELRQDHPFDKIYLRPRKADEKDSSLQQKIGHAA